MLKIIWQSYPNNYSLIHLLLCFNSIRAARRMRKNAIRIVTIINPSTNNIKMSSVVPIPSTIFNQPPKR